MLLTEDRVLISVELLIQDSAVNVCWANRILRDGEVIDSKPHRGAFPLDENLQPIGLDEAVEGALNIKDILGEAGEAAQMRVGVLENQLNHCDSVIHNLRNENENLTGSIFQKNEQIVSLSNLLTAKDTEILMLKNEVAALKNNQ
jgi:hypothetical protein